MDDLREFSHKLTMIGNAITTLVIAQLNPAIVEIKGPIIVSFMDGILLPNLKNLLKRLRTDSIVGGFRARTHASRA